MRDLLGWARMKIKILTLIASALLIAAPAGAATFSQATVDNLNAAYNGENNAHHRYLAFAQKADEEGYGQVAKLFRAAARAEEIHRDNHKAVILKAGGALDDKALDAVSVGTTAQNLQAAIKGESYERDTMYPGFIDTAKAEDAREAVRTFNFAVSAEKEHAKLYQTALDQLGRNDPATYYVCTICGNTVTARPDEKCPVCRRTSDKFVVVD
ncbi:rubrerythrin-2 [mine drainage metagenome]|uniref:Rubrerythrin-2 n=1 Tax=mine drainage metagenome TaxID=410659 RepID=A0A1J5SYF7_9ZZZZ